MNKIKLLSVLFILFISTIFAQDTQKKIASVDKVLASVTKALDEIETKGELPAPAKVNITFKTEISKDSEAGINILIFKFGKKWKRQQTNEISYNFKLIPAESFEKTTIEEELAKAMQRAIDEAIKIEGDTFKLTDFSVQISFILEKNTSVGGEYEIIPLPITPSLGRSWKKKAVHSIKITFDNNG